MPDHPFKDYFCTKKVNQEEYDVLESTNKKKNLLEPLAANLETKSRRGKVKVEKPKPVFTYKRRYDSDDDGVSTKKTIKPKGSLETQIESDKDSMIKDFLYQVKTCPHEYFLKIVLMKLQEMCGLSSLEIRLLVKVLSTSQQVICNNLPPQMQILLKDRMCQQNAENIHASRNAANSPTPCAARPRMPQGGQIEDDMVKKFVNDINEVLFGEKKVFDMSASDSLQTRSSVYDRICSCIAPASSQYSGSSSTNFPPPPSFQPQSSNFVPPPANFPSAYKTCSPCPRIPGLTLIECDEPQHSDFPQYKWMAP